MSADLKSQLLLRHRKKEAELESRAREKLELARLRFEEEQRRKQEELRQRKVKQLIIRVYHRPPLNDSLCGPTRFRINILENS